MVPSFSGPLHQPGAGITTGTDEMYFRPSSPFAWRLVAQGLAPGHRQRRDHRDGPRAPRANGAGQHLAARVAGHDPLTAAGRARAPACPHPRGERPPIRWPTLPSGNRRAPRTRKRKRRPGRRSPPSCKELSIAQAALLPFADDERRSRDAGRLQLVPGASLPRAAAGARMCPTALLAGVPFRGAAGDYELLLERSSRSGLNRRVRRHDRGRAWFELAEAVIT